MADLMQFKSLGSASDSKNYRCRMIRSSRSTMSDSTIPVKTQAPEGNGIQAASMDWIVPYIALHSM